MNLGKTDIDSIQLAPGDLTLKIDKFLTDFNFPSFKSDRKTAEFLVEALETASLPGIAAEVKRDLEHKLDIEGASLCMQLYIILCHKSDCMSCFLLYSRDWVNCMLSP